MAQFRVHVSQIDKSKLINKKVKKAMRDAMTDITLDMKRVASLSAPHDTGFLEKNAEHEVYVGSQYIEGTVGFSAMRKGFNYAEWTHNEDYELGEKSKRKKGGKSKFGSGRVPVGKGYLENALKQNEAGYLQHLQDAYRDALGD
jgi:hypothetical protein